MDIGVFIPIGNNGWLISTSSPQDDKSYAIACRTGCVMARPVRCAKVSGVISQRSMR